MDFLNIPKTVEPEDIESYHQIFAVENQSPVVPSRIRLLDLIDYIVSISGASEVASDLAAHIEDTNAHQYAKYLITLDESSAISVDYLFEILAGLSYSESNLSLQNSWTDYGDSGYGTPKALKAGKVVSLQGLLLAGTTTDNTVIANIPEGYRPTTTRRIGNLGGTRLTVTSTGTILIAGYTSGLISLSGVCYVV